MITSLLPHSLSLPNTKAFEKGFAHNLHVKPGGHVTHIVNVVLNPIGEGDLTVSFHLPESGEAGEHRKTEITPEGVVTHFLHRERTWPDQAHVAAQHVPELGDLI